jgi:hypothetical protein
MDNEGNGAHQKRHAADSEDLSVRHLTPFQTFVLRTFILTDEDRCKKKCSTTTGRSNARVYGVNVNPIIGAAVLTLSRAATMVKNVQQSFRRQKTTGNG